MGKISHFFKIQWKLLVTIITIVALVAFLWAIREQLAETWQTIGRVHWWFLLLIIPLLAWKYDAQARLYQALFYIVGNKYTYRQMYETSLELNFINNVFPSGGVSGISYFGARMRAENVTAGKATLVHIMKLMLLFVSFEVLLVLGLFLLALEGNVNSLLLMITVIVSSGMVFGTALLVYVLGGQSRVNAFHAFLRMVANNVLTVVTRRRHNHELTRVKFLLDELHNNFKVIKSRYRELKRPLTFALLVNVAEIFTIYAVYAAFGQWVNIGAVILAYSVANVAGMVSVLPGGVGIYEALMATVLVAAGIPIAIALPVTIMFRVLSTLVQLPPGYYFYHRTIHQGHKLVSDNV